MTPPDRLASRSRPRAFALVGLFAGIVTVLVVLVLLRRLRGG